MTTYIKFDIDVNTWVTREADPDDTWSSESTDGTVTVNSATVVDEDGYNVLGTEASLSAGDTIYLLWAQYSTGDSFGSYGGRYELLEVTTDEVVAAVRRDHWLSVNDYSVPWNGYFECLDDVYVQKFTL